MPDPAILTIVADNGFSFETSCVPSGINWSKSALFNEVAIIARSSPIITYSSSSAIVLPINLEFYAMFGEAQKEVADIQKSFMSLTFPVTPGIQPPPMCRITYGGVFKQWKSVCISASPASGKHNIWDESGLPLTGSISLQFKGIEIDNVASDEWLASTSFDQLGWGGIT